MWRGALRSGERRIHADLQRQQLDGAQPVERRLPRLRDRAHAAAPEQAEHFVAGEKPPGFRDLLRLPAVRAGTVRHPHGLHGARDHFIRRHAAEIGRRRGGRRRLGKIVRLRHRRHC